MSSTQNRSPSEDQLDDSQVLSRLKRGGVQELSHLFQHIRENLKAMIRTRLDPRIHPRVDASDVVQDTYLRAVNSLENYLANPNIHPVIWLRLLGKHLVAETHRRHFRAKRTPQMEYHASGSSLDRTVQLLADSMQSVHTQVAHQEIVSRVKSMFETMNEHDREVLEMRHTDEMSIAEIAATLCISLEAAKKRYQRALARFREQADDLFQ